MSGPRITDAAVEAAKEALRDYTGDCVCHEAFRTRGRIDPTCWPCGLSGAHEDILTAALPHIRRAVIEELVEKYEAIAMSDPFPIAAAFATRVLCAELEGDDRA